MNSTTYLQRLGHSWYVRIKVPRNLQACIGNTHIRQALHTRDLNEANRLKWKYIEAIKSRLRRLEGLSPSESSTQGWRESIQKALSEDNHELAETLELVATDKAEEIHEKTGSLKAAREWYELATSHGQTLDEIVNTWLSNAEYQQSTKSQHRRAYQDLRSYLGGEALPSKVTDDLAMLFVEDVLKKSGSAYETQRRKLNSLVAFWNWMGLHKHVKRGFNPWKGFTLSKQRTVKKTEDKRNYTEEELVKLFAGQVEYAGLADVMILGLYTGARLDEICSLKVGDIKKNADGVFLVSIKKAKTHAGIRTIAVSHPIPCSVLSARLNPPNESKQVLFAEFKPGGYDEKLSWAVSKAFGRHRDKMELSRATDFHSFRRTHITLMENLGIDQVRIARYVGHELPTIAFSLYSGGSTENTQIEVAKQIKYPPAIEKALGSFYDRTRVSSV